MELTAEEILKEASEKPEFKKEKFERISKKNIEKLEEPKLIPLKVDPKPKKEIKKKIKIRKPRFIKLKEFIKKQKDKIGFVKNLAFYSIAYGIPINYMLWGIFNIKFGVFTFPAYGVLFHFLKEETPLIWRKYFPVRNR